MSDLIGTREDIVATLQKPGCSTAEVFAIGVSLVMLASAKEGMTIQDSIDHLRYMVYSDMMRREVEGQMRRYWDQLRSEWSHVKPEGGFRGTPR
jgi:hypothetical protein